MQKKRADDVDWKAVYFRYRFLDTQLGRADPAQRLSQPLLHRAMSGSVSFEKELLIARELALKSKDLQLPDVALLEEMREFAELSSGEMMSARSPFYTNVYHLAFNYVNMWRRPTDAVPAAKKCNLLYRGQVSDDWYVDASLYRGEAGARASPQVIRDRAAKVCETARAISSAMPKYSVRHAVAIAQHYSGALGVQTWLSDFSRDPWVALFFASDTGRAGQTGIVWYISPSEYGRKFTSARLEMVVPRGVKRISNQKGVFVSLTDPLIFEQYVAFGRELTFRQLPGVVFEDDSLNVTRDLMYPPKDGVKERLKMLPAVAPCLSECVPETCAIPSDTFAEPSNPEVYLRLLGAWLERICSEHHLSGKARKSLSKALPVFGRFHAGLYSYAHVEDKLPPLDRSINRLLATFEFAAFRVADGKDFSVSEAIRYGYRLHAGDLGQDHRELLLGLLDSICSPLHKG